MKRASASIICILAMSVVSCSPMLTVSQDFSERTDFRTYKTFDWMPEDSKPDPTLAGLDRIDVDMEVKTALDKYLTEKGFERNTNSPDVFVAYYIGVARTVWTSNWSADYWGVVGYSQSEVADDAYFFVDLVDANSQERIWRGRGQMAKNRDPSPDIMRKNIDRGIKEVLAQYPPGQKPGRY